MSEVGEVNIPKELKKPPQIIERVTKGILEVQKANREYWQIRKDLDERTQKRTVYGEYAKSVEKVYASLPKDKRESLYYKAYRPFMKVVGAAAHMYSEIIDPVWNLASFLFRVPLREISRGKLDLTNPVRRFYIFKARATGYKYENLRKDRMGREAIKTAPQVAGEVVKRKASEILNGYETPDVSEIKKISSEIKDIQKSL